MNKKRYIIMMVIILIAILSTHAFSMVKESNTIVLEFGMFAGSNWDVANADSYIIIDKAIERFEKNIKMLEYIIPAASGKMLIQNGSPKKCSWVKPLMCL